MKKISIAFISLMATSAMADTTVVTFDDTSGVGNLANGYGGINWNNNFTYFNYPLPPYNAASGSGRAYANYQGDPTFSFATPVVFDGMYLAGPEPYGAILYELYLKGNLVHISEPLLRSGTPTWLGSTYGGQVDSVTLFGRPYSVVIDNVTYHTNAVPEPAVVLPMLVGLIAIARKRRR